MEANNFDNNSNDNKNRKSSYGLLSLIAIIVGTVIGSGIYVKNDQLYQDTGSAIAIIIGWVIAGLLVLAILISFIEIASISKLKKEQGTFTSFARNLFSKNMALFVGAYFIFIYFPYIIAAEAVFAANQLLIPLETSGIIVSASFWSWYLLTFIALAMICFASYIVIRSLKATKIIQSSGTILKLIPLIVIIFAAVVILIAYWAGADLSVNNVFDPGSEINNNPAVTGRYPHSQILSILFIIPAILFAFDGFLFANSLSREAKTENTFRNAAIISVFFITIIYITFSLSTLLIGDPTQGFTIQLVILAIFPGHVFFAQILNMLISFIIFISIVTAMFGYGTSSMFALADASNKNEVQDKNARLIKRNVEGNPVNSALIVLFLALGFCLFLRVFDGIALLIGPDGSATAFSVSMTDYITNISTTISFSFYCLLIFGALINRFQKKVEVEKIKGFFVTSIFAIGMLFLIVILQLYEVISNLIQYSVSGVPGELGIAILQIMIITCFISFIIGFFLYNKARIKNTPQEIWDEKIIHQHEYESYHDDLD